MRKLIHPNSKTQQSPHSRFSCNGSTQSFSATNPRTDPSTSSKIPLLGRLNNNPYSNVLSPSPPLSDAESFKNVLKNCLQMCSAYIQALNTLCSTGTSLAESLGQVFGHNIKLSTVRFPPTSQCTQNSAKKPSSGSDSDAPSYADVLASNVDTKIYCDMAKQFFTVWHHLSNATAGASATIKTETLFALQDLINKIESSSIITSDASHHMHSAHQNGPVADQNDAPSTLIDSIESTKSCLLSYIELQTKFSYSSWKALNCLSKALKADSSMKDVVKRLNLEFDLKSQLSSKQRQESEDSVDYLPSCSLDPSAVDRLTDATSSGKSVSSPSVLSSRKKKERPHSSRTLYGIEEALDLLSIRPQKQGSSSDLKKPGSSSRKTPSKRRSAKPRQVGASFTRSPTSSPITSSLSQSLWSKSQSASVRDTRRKKSPDGFAEYQKRIGEYQKRIEACNRQKQLRSDASRGTSSRLESAQSNHFGALVPNQTDQLEYLTRLKSQSTSTWPGKGSVNSSQGSDSASSPMMPPVDTNNFRSIHLDPWSPWSTLTDSSRNNTSWNMFDQITSGDSNVNTNPASPTSIAYDPFGTQCNPSSLKNSARQIFKPPNESASRDSAIASSNSINHVLNNNLASLSESSSAIGINHFVTLDDFIEPAAFTREPERLARRFNPANHATSPTVDSVLSTDHSPSVCTPSSSLSIDPLRAAKTSTWPLKQSPINSTLTNGSTAILHSEGLNENGNPTSPWPSPGQEQLISYALPSQDNHFIPCGQSHNLWSIGSNCRPSDPFNRHKDHSSVTNITISGNHQSLNRTNNSGNATNSQAPPTSRYTLFEANNNSCRSIDQSF